MCTPSYANIFMEHFTKKCVNPSIQATSVVYLRFINDILFEWICSKIRFSGVNLCVKYQQKTFIPRYQMINEGQQDTS